MTALPSGSTGYAELAVRITADGHVDIVQDLGDQVLGRHAGHRIAAALRKTSTPIRAPRPGRAVLACRCGAVLDADQLHRRRPRTGDGGRLRPITCKECS